MSIVAAHVAPERAVVVVDSLAVHPPPLGPGLAGKMFVLPHAGGVIVGRGDLGLLVATALTLQVEAIDFDAARKRLPIVAAELARARGDAAREFQILLVGLSARAAGIAACGVFRAHGRGLVFEPVVGEYVAPWAESLDGLPDVRDEATALETARALLAAQAETTCPAGPPLVCASITRSAVVITTAP